jgi:hypothetical protein
MLKVGDIVKYKFHPSSPEDEQVIGVVVDYGRFYGYSVFWFIEQSTSKHDIDRLIKVS